MAYTPTVVTLDNLRSTAFTNIYDLITAYKTGSQSVNAVNNSLDSVTPSYNIWPIENSNEKRDFAGDSRNRLFSVQIDFASPQRQGWKAVDAMVDLVDKALRTEKDDLQTARLDYLGSQIVSIDPLIINDQQMFVISVSYQFKVLI